MDPLRSARGGNTLELDLCQVGGVIEIVKGWVGHIAKTVLVGRFRRDGVVESVM